jgi:hypothetical protein
MVRGTRLPGAVNHICMSERLILCGHLGPMDTLHAQSRALPWNPRGGHWSALRGIGPLFAAQSSTALKGRGPLRAVHWLFPGEGQPGPCNATAGPLPGTTKMNGSNGHRPWWRSRRQGLLVGLRGNAPAITSPVRAP